jgi:hypothetical protein
VGKLNPPLAAQSQTILSQNIGLLPGLVCFGNSYHRDSHFEYQIVEVGLPVLPNEDFPLAGQQI